MPSPKTIMDRRLKLLGRLFTRVQGPVVKYIVKPGCEEEAAATWKDHGVCPDCSTRAITVGRCIGCGWRSEGLIARQKARAEAEKCVRCGNQGAGNFVETLGMKEALGAPHGSRICDDCFFAILD